MTDLKDIDRVYYLHVQEHRTAQPPPGVPSMRVEVIQTPSGAFDEVVMRDVKIGDEEWAFVRPRGKGWRVHSCSFDNFTVYRRPHYVEAHGMGQGGAEVCD